MFYEATLNYDKTLIRQAAFAFWRRTVGLESFIYLALLIIIFVVLITQGDFSWLTGAVAATLVFTITQFAKLYFQHYRNSSRKFQLMCAPQARFIAEEASFTISSGIGSTTLIWPTICEVWRFPGFWILLFSKAQVTVLPLSGLSVEMREFILKRVHAFEGKVI